MPSNLEDGPFFPVKWYLAGFKDVSGGFEGRWDSFGPRGRDLRRDAGTTLTKNK